ncbi:MAG: hypothetical protein QOH78_2079, partial [Verrucomicrobiota bacterium]
KRLGETPIERVNVKGWLESWLESKANSAPATRSAYQQTVREFLVYCPLNK